MTQFENDGQASGLSQFLEIYKRSLPIGFDEGVKKIIDSAQERWFSAMQKLGLRREFSINATQGNLSRVLLEEDILSLAENLGLQAGTFKTGGGSYHLKISTENLILTVHTLGDRDGKMSRFTQYKEALCRSNPAFKDNFSSNNIQPTYIGPLFRDIDIGLPIPFPPNVFHDERLYATLCLPRFQNSRNETKLLLPNTTYSKFIYEYDFMDIRVSESRDLTINIYTENSIDPTQIILKKDDANEIIDKQIRANSKDNDIEKSN
jgi:hypothetical protein